MRFRYDLDAEGHQDRRHLRAEVLVVERLVERRRHLRHFGQHVTVPSSALWCPSSAVRAVGHGRRWVMVRALALADRPVALVWAKWLWRSADAAREMGTRSEDGRRHRRAVPYSWNGLDSLYWIRRRLLASRARLEPVA